jgi:hypothetical protein
MNPANSKSDTWLPPDQDLICDTGSPDTWSGSEGEKYPPEGPPYDPLPHSGMYSDPCPVGKVSWKGDVPGNTGSRDLIFNDLIPYGSSGESFPIPVLINPGLKSASLCRGACGLECDSNRCRSQGNITLFVPRGTCSYSRVLACDSHQGCRDHDECYDWCAEEGEGSIPGSCHRVCDSRCFSNARETMDSRTGGVGTCAARAGLTGAEEMGYSPPFDGTILFSDPPVYTSLMEAIPSPMPIPIVFCPVSPGHPKKYAGNLPSPLPVRCRPGMNQVPG